MHRLHVKIFLWFWLGVLVVSGTLVSMTELSHSRADDDRAWEEKYTPRLRHVGAAGVADPPPRRAGGARALRRLVRDGPRRAELHLRRRRPRGARAAGGAAVQRLLSSMADWPAGEPRVDAAERIIAERVDRRSRRVAHRDGRLARAVGAEPVAVRVPVAGHLRRASEHGRARADRRGARSSPACCASCWRGTSRARSISCALAARNIASQQLQTRVDGSVLERRDELADLGRDFDRMAERIEHLVTAQRRLLADVSHALRSPLARLNVALGLARQRNGQPTSEHLDRIETEAERLNKLIGQLLTMAQSGQRRRSRAADPVRSGQHRRRGQLRRRVTKRGSATAR